MIKVELTEDDFVKGFMTDPLKLALQLVGGAAVGLGFVVLSRIDTIGRLPLLHFFALSFLYTAPVLVVAFFGIRYYFTLKGRKIYAQEAFFRDPYQIGWSNDGKITLILQSGLVREILPSNIVKLRENRSRILLYISTVHAILIPKRSFLDRETLEDFSQMLKKHYVKASIF